MRVRDNGDAPRLIGRLSQNRFQLSRWTVDKKFLLREAVQRLSRRMRMRRMVSDTQTLYDPAVFQVLLDDLVDILLVNVGVPDIFGVDHNHRPLVASVEAARIIDSYPVSLAVEP